MPQQNQNHRSHRSPSSRDVTSVSRTVAASVASPHLPLPPLPLPRPITSWKFWKRLLRAPGEPKPERKSKRVVVDTLPNLVVTQPQPVNRVRETIAMREYRRAMEMREATDSRAGFRSEEMRDGKGEVVGTRETRDTKEVKVRDPRAEEEDRREGEGGLEGSIRSNFERRSRFREHLDE